MSKYTLTDSLKAVYVIQCDKLRYNAKGETLFQNMMKNKQEMFMLEFLKKVDVYTFLEPEETLQGYLADDPNSKLYMSKLGLITCYFIQTKGFEFIFI